MLKTTLIFSILALLFGAFYREYTKYLNFDGKTTLSILHTHTFLIAVFLPLIFTLITEHLKHSIKEMKNLIIIYYAGFFLTIGAMFARGITEVKAIALTSGIDHMISGIA